MDSPHKARVVSLALKATLSTVLDVSPQSGSAAGGEIIHETLLDGRYGRRLRIAWAKTAQDISQLKATAGVPSGRGQVSLTGLRRPHRLRHQRLEVGRLEAE